MILLDRCKEQLSGRRLSARLGRGTGVNPTAAAARAAANSVSFHPGKESGEYESCGRRTERDFRVELPQLAR